MTEPESPAAKRQRRDSISDSTSKSGLRTQRPSDSPPATSFKPIVYPTITDMPSRNQTPQDRQLPHKIQQQLHQPEEPRQQHSPWHLHQAQKQQQLQPQQEQQQHLHLQQQQQQPWQALQQQSPQLSLPMAMPQAQLLSAHPSSNLFPFQPHAQSAVLRPAAHELPNRLQSCVPEAPHGSHATAANWTSLPPGIAPAQTDRTSVYITHMNDCAAVMGHSCLEHVAALLRHLETNMPTIDTSFVNSAKQMLEAFLKQVEVPCASRELGAAQAGNVGAHGAMMVPALYGSDNLSYVRNAVAQMSPADLLAVGLLPNVNTLDLVRLAKIGGERETVFQFQQDQLQRLQNHLHHQIQQQAWQIQQTQQQMPPVSAQPEHLSATTSRSLLQMFRPFTKKMKRREPRTGIDFASASLADFTMLQVLGTGTFGKVQLCQHIATQQYFCVKVLSKARVLKLKQREHLRNERDVLTAVRHRFIVRLFATYQDDHFAYLLMEFVPGGEIFNYIRRAGTLPESVARVYAAEIVLGLEELHRCGIVYRDLKPENLMLDEMGHIKLTDFGFAKYLGQGRTYSMCGTPEYIAPEIILGKGHSVTVDWWSLGILLFEMLAGYPPFSSDDAQRTIFEKILSEKPDLPSTFSLAAASLVRQLLVADPQLRLGAEGADQIKRHTWFADVDWNAILTDDERVGPLNPEVRAENDTHNFYAYTAADVPPDELLDPAAIEAAYFEGF